MKTCLSLLVVAMILCFYAPAFGGDGSAASLSDYYRAAIDHEIESCLEKTSLQNSRSDQLQRKGHLEASKARFLMTHRDHLVDEMVESDIERKPYKIQRYLNEQFHCNCYAPRQARASF